MFIAERSEDLRQISPFTGNRAHIVSIHNYIIGYMVIIVKLFSVR